MDEAPGAKPAEYYEPILILLKDTKEATLRRTGLFKGGGFERLTSRFPYWFNTTRYIPQPETPPETQEELTIGLFKSDEYDKDSVEEYLKDSLSDMQGQLLDDIAEKLNDAWKDFEDRKRRTRRKIRERSGNE